MLNRERKTLRYPWLAVLLILVPSLTIASPVPKAYLDHQDKNLTKVQVMLLGQPCLLQGPLEQKGFKLDELTLRKVHSLGPAQLYPALSPLEPERLKSIQLTKEAINQLNSFPNPLKQIFYRYRDKLTKRLEAQMSFLNALDNFEKTKQIGPLQSSAKSNFLKHKNTQSYEALLKKAQTERTKSPQEYRKTVGELFDVYNENIEPDPEREFHKATLGLQIEYVCTLEELEDGERSHR